MAKTHLLSRWASLAGVVAAVIMVGGWFQAPPSSSEVPVPTIRVSTHLVLVDVIVTDKQGKLVTGLKQDDFAVQEKGKNQKIAFFSPASEEQKPPAPELPPGIYSNKPEYRSPGGPLMVLLLDAANTPFKDQAYARQQMLKFVREQYKPGQRMAIFTLTNGLSILQDFTSDPNVLLGALQKYQPASQEMPNAAAPRVPSTSSDAGQGAQLATAGMVERMREFQNIQLAYVQDRRVETTTAAMRGLARILGGIPGRKSVVWVTAAFPFSLIPENRNFSEAEMAETLPSIKQLELGTRAAGSMAGVERTGHAQEIREASAQLASAQIAIYPIDARGLMSGMEATSDDLPSRQFHNTSENASVRMSDAVADQETMREIARETGGVAYVNQNEIKEGVVAAMADSGNSYTLGYYPEDKKWDGKYRSIKVKLNRDGVDARYRRGYFAIDPAASKGRNPEQGAAEALQDSAPDTLVTFSAQVKPAGGGKLGVDFLVDAHTLSAEDVSGGNKKFNVVLYAACFSSDGKMLGNQSLKVDQAFDAGTYLQILEKGMLLHLDLKPPAGASQLRMAVEDNRTGHTGSLTAPL
jgi:VWFA-related protein